MRYAILGDPEREAIELATRYEGILFWHTGGSPALHAWADHLVAPRG